jgi:ferredoxin-NADP reductase
MLSTDRRTRVRAVGVGAAFAAFATVTGAAAADSNLYVIAELGLETRRRTTCATGRVRRWSAEGARLQALLAARRPEATCAAIRGVSSDTRVTKAIAATARWQSCAIVRVATRTRAIKSFFLRLSETFDYAAGQHVDVRLTAPDGYTAMRSYSIASAPSDSKVIELAIERLADGEVSPFFHDVAQVGDTIELRGPLGGHFLWPGPSNKPVLLIGAGSGVVPLMAMIRYRKASGEPAPVALLLASRTWGDVLFRDELLELERSLPDFALALALTREPATRSTDFSRRIDAGMVADVAARLPVSPGSAFVCGSNAFVDIAADAALALGLESRSIKTERYGA